MESFGTILHKLRVAHFGKQQCLAVRVGCTEAAVSFWESGSRLPSSELLAEVVTRMNEAGVTSDQISELVDAYQVALAARRTSHRLCVILNAYAHDSRP